MLPCEVNRLNSSEWKRGLNHISALERPKLKPISAKNSLVRINMHILSDPLIARIIFLDDGNR